MGLFTRRAAPIEANTATTTTTAPREKGFASFRRGIMGGGHHHSRTTAPHSADAWNRRPTFGQWLKGTWLDLLTMVAMGVVGLGVYEAHPAPSRSFPVTFQDGEVVYPEFAYPLRNEIVPIWAAALLAALVPIFVILCMQIRVRSFWDVNNGVIGLLYSLITAAVFQVFLKWLIGVSNNTVYMAT
jgi:diacylglycerol diphosphate phosphatase / phosphatidate phosphatase